MFEFTSSLLGMQRNDPPDPLVPQEFKPITTGIPFNNPEVGQRVASNVSLISSSSRDIAGPWKLVEEELKKVSDDLRNDYAKKYDAYGIDTEAKGLGEMTDSLAMTLGLSFAALPKIVQVTEDSLVPHYTGGLGPLTPVRTFGAFGKGLWDLGTTSVENFLTERKLAKAYEEMPRDIPAPARSEAASPGAGMTKYLAAIDEPEVFLSQRYGKHQANWVFDVDQYLVDLYGTREKLAAGAAEAEAYREKAGLPASSVNAALSTRPAAADIGEPWATLTGRNREFMQLPVDRNFSDRIITANFSSDNSLHMDAVRHELGHYLYTPAVAEDEAKFAATMNLITELPPEAFAARADRPYALTDAKYREFVPLAGAVQRESLRETGERLSTPEEVDAFLKKYEGMSEGTLKSKGVSPEFLRYLKERKDKKFGPGIDAGVRFLTPAVLAGSYSYEENLTV